MNIAHQSNSYQSHAAKFCDRLVDAPSVLGHLLRVVKSEKLLIVSEGKREVLKLSEDSTSRMVLLFMGESQVPHVLAQYVDAVGVFASGTRSTDLFNSTNNAQRNV